MAGIGRTNPKAGRKKGTPNKDKAPVKEMASRLGVDPLEILLLYAKGDWKALGYESEKITVYSRDYSNEKYVIDPAVRMSAAADACRYMYPQLKQIDAQVKMSASDADQAGSEYSNEEIAELQKSMQYDQE